MERNGDELKPFELGFYNTKQMRGFYNKGETSWNTIMESISWYVGEKLGHGNDWSPNQVLRIIKCCGIPTGYYLPHKLQEMVDALPEPIKK